MIEKIFLKPDNIAEFTCSQCRKSWKKDLSSFIKNDKPIIFRCKCSCGNSFSLLLERRRHPRIDTNLSGAFIHDKRKSRGVINIKNISHGGLGFELKGNYLMATGDIVLLRFNLDDAFNTLITKEAYIKKIRDKYIGSEFLEKVWGHDLLNLYLNA